MDAGFEGMLERQITDTDSLWTEESALSGIWAKGLAGISLEGLLGLWDEFGD